MENTLVTVIVPIYNVEKYLRKCVDSILGQTYSFLEIILVDDGSTDSSSALCDEIKTKDERIKVIHKSNGGLSSSRNAGLKQAKGDYVLFIDGDDWIRENAVEILLSLAKEKKVGVVQMGISRVLNEEEVRNSSVNSSFKIVSKEECLKNLCKGPDYVSMCNKLISRTYWNLLCFPEGYLYEDMYVNYKLLSSLEYIVVCDADMYFYRQHQESICKKSSIYGHDNYFNALIERCEYYKENHLEENYKQELIFHMDFYIECYLYEKKNNNTERCNKIKKLFKEERSILNQQFKTKRISWWLFDFCPYLYDIVRSIYVTMTKK